MQIAPLDSKKSDELLLSHPTRLSIIYASTQTIANCSANACRMHGLEKPLRASKTPHLLTAALVRSKTLDLRPKHGVWDLLQDCLETAMESDTRPRTIPSRDLFPSTIPRSPFVNLSEVARRCNPCSPPPWPRPACATATLRGYHYRPGKDSRSRKLLWKPHGLFCTRKQPFVRIVYGRSPSVRNRFPHHFLTFSSAYTG